MPFFIMKRKVIQEYEMLVEAECEFTAHAITDNLSLEAYDLIESHDVERTCREISILKRLTP